MGIALFHLLPESAESFTQYFEVNENNSKWKNLPSSFFIAFISYSLILLLEKVAFDSHSITEHDHGDHHQVHHSHDDHSGEHKHSDLTKPLLDKDYFKDQHDVHSDHSHKNEQIEEPKDSQKIKIDSPNENKIKEKIAKAPPKLDKKNSQELKSKKSPINSPKHDHNRTHSFIKKKPLHDELLIKEKGYEEDDFDHNTNGNDEESEDDDELILKNVVSSKGKFASYLQARNIRNI
jgi:hypothetical protein